MRNEQMENHVNDILSEQEQVENKIRLVKKRLRYMSIELKDIDRKCNILFSITLILLILTSILLSVSLVHIFSGDNSSKAEKTITETTERFIIENHIPCEIEEKEKNVSTYYDVPLSKDLQDHIFEVSEKNDIDHKLVIAIIRRESNYKDSVVGDNGLSFGLMQIQKRYSIDRMKKLGVDNLLDPYQNIEVGVDILRELFDTGKSIEWVLMAYNGGPSSANRHVTDGVVTDYAKTVLEYRNSL